MARPREFDVDHAVDQAMDLFWTQGYPATTPAQLAEHLEIGRGSLYNAFGSKHNLFQRALRRYAEQQASTVEQIAADDGTALERIRRVLETVLGLAASDPRRRGCLVTNSTIELAAVDADTRREVRRVLRRQEAALVGLVREAQRDGDADPGLDPDATALHLMTVLNGAQVMARVTPDRRRLRGLIDTTLRTL